MEQRRPNQNQNQNLPDPEKRKKIFLWLVVFIAAFSVIFFSFSYLKKSSSEKAKKEVTQQKERGECGLDSDEAIMKKAREDKDPLVCLCLGDERVRFRCEEDAQNEFAFAQARAQYKEEPCEMIKNNNELKKSCLDMVLVGVEYLKKEDPAYLANNYASNGNYNEAIEMLVGLEKTKTDIPLMLSLAVSYANKALAEHKEGEYIPKAEELVNKVIALNPENAETYRVQGFVYEVKPNIVKAIESYNKSLEINPNYILALAGRGHAYDLFGDTNKALEDFKKAAELDKNKEQMLVYANLCRLESFRENLLEEALENCKIVVNSSASTAFLKGDTYQILSDIFIKKGQYPEALIYLEKAKTVTPNDPNLRVSFARFYTAQKEYQKAFGEAQKALEIDSLKTIAYHAQAYAFLMLENYDQAEKQALKGLEIIDKDPSLLISNKPYYKKQLNYILADVYAAKGDQSKELQYKEAGDGAMER